MKAPIKLRRRDAGETADLPDTLPLLLKRLYASRGVRTASDLERSVKGMLPWQALSGIEKATEMLYDAFREGTRIVVVGDFDADGATSTALSVLSLRALGCDNVTYLVPNRFEDGYGLSPEVVDQAHARGAQMIMTVDNGISSHAGVDHAHALGIPVLVTDHHLPGETLPAAEAIINPNLRDCDFPSKSLAGVGVAFYLMLALRTLLRDKGWFESRGIAVPNLAEYLDLVALGTVADVVPLDTNNRILTWQGLSRIRAGKCRPGIKALLEIANRDPLKLAASDLGFALGPRLNAAGRLDDMSVGVALLLCDNIGEARVLASELDALNQTRKEIEQGMQAEALTLCEKLERSGDTLPGGLAAAHYLHHVVYRIKIGIAQIGHFGFDIARHGQIEQENGAVAAFAQGAFHHAFADNRQRAGGRTDNNVRLFQTFIDVAQRNHLSAHFTCQHLRTFAGAVGNDHLLHLVFAKMARHQLDGFARSHQQYGDGRQGFKNLTGKGTGRESNRNRTGANVGFGSHTLRHGE